MLKCSLHNESFIRNNEKYFFNKYINIKVYYNLNILSITSTNLNCYTKYYLTISASIQVRLHMNYLKQIFNNLQQLTCFSLVSDFVRISAALSDEGTYSISIAPSKYFSRI